MSTRLGLILSVVVATAALPATSSAQSSTPAASPLAAGTRVRVSASDRRDAITGVVVFHSADSLVVRSDKDSGAVALSTGHVSRVEVSRGRRTQKARGAGIGYLSGVGIGALAGLALYEKPSCGGESWICLDFGPQFDAVVGATFVGALGALVGTWMGSRERELWGPAPASRGRDARLGVAPAGGGVALTASLPF